jgi:hypothetical protein
MVKFPLKTLKVKACLSQSTQRSLRKARALVLALNPEKIFFVVLCVLDELCAKHFFPAVVNFYIGS